ncbi:LysR family transcriptional regulator [Bradyrhizobium sp. DASA03120]|uniref:LysR family transcriptional regulator n=1 Tax=Bradyrhizobium sp. SMVTL-02 TaxID=3395917 RepID=UPI003F725520
MELRKLRAFVEVVRQGGFSKAGKVVFATQSTVSKAVKQLEDEIGVPLLDRIGHRSRLTAAGEIVYRHAIRILTERDDLVSELNALRGLKCGILKLGLPPVGSGILFAKLFAIFRKCYPGVEMRLVEYGSERLEEIVLAGEIELAASLLPVSEAFEWQDVKREPLAVLLPIDHKLSRCQSLDLSKLREMPVILFETGFASNRVIMDACRRHGFEPRVVARSSPIDFVIELAAAGMGAAFLPRMIAEQRRHLSLAWVPLHEADTDWHIAMIWRRDACLSPAARAWLDLVACGRAEDHSVND